MKVLSFGTEGRFREYINRLEGSLNEHGMPHTLKIIPAQKNKFDAALKKPRYILEHLDEPVLWLDADSFVTGHIELPDGDWDAGFLPHWGSHKAELVCAVLAFRPTDDAVKFLERWAEVCEQRHEKFNGTEHDRLLRMKPEFKLNEVNLTDCLKGNLVVNYKIRKEHYV